LARHAAFQRAPCPQISIGLQVVILIVLLLMGLI
jgi:hypothetical protein